MSQITIRDLDPNLERLIRQTAETEHLSLNEVVQRLLLKAVGLSPNSSKKRDLRKLAGRWTEREAAAFEASQEGFRAIDDEVWK
jgi:hypothetical protein